MRIHLGHHFYGAGNLGDDFMVAGFLAAMRTLAPHASFTCCVPFALAPLKQRFPEIAWLPYDDASRVQSIAACDAWVGLGGSPFQSAQSRWFIDHLVRESALCAHARKPMFFLGVGVQIPAELAVPEVRELCIRAAGIWARDTASAQAIAALPAAPPIAAAADLAHLFFRETPPPPAVAGRLTLVANFDFAAWPGQAAFLHTAVPSTLSVPLSPSRSRSVSLSPSLSLPFSDRVWLAQESRDLPGAERALHAALPPAERERWRLVIPDPQTEPATRITTLAATPLAAASLATAPLTVASPTPAPSPSGSLRAALARWPSGEWLVTSRYHAALAGAWAGSKIIVIATNEKLRAAARELGCPSIAPDADEATVIRAFESAAASAAAPVLPPAASADRAFAACAAFVRAAS